MKKMRTVLVSILIPASILMYFTCCGPAVKKEYYKKNESKGTIEKKYSALGPYKVKSEEAKVNENHFKNIKIWYPEELSSSNKQYPVVVFANGSGVPYSAYEEVFFHLASWGFIAIGNDDKNSWSGDSSAKTLNFLLTANLERNSSFFQKVNINQIGISGHSQGGVAAVNAVSNQSNGRYYISIFAASTTKHALAMALKWPYDVSKIKVPYFSVAGTGIFDAGNGKDAESGIAPLTSVIENFNKLQKNIPAVMARRKETDHGEMLFKADGYMTAWFFYTLLGDQDASKAFTGPDPEIQQNSLWQDIKLKNLN